MRVAGELALIYAAAFTRALGIGLLGVVLGVYLYRIGLDATQIGLVLAGGLAGMTAATAAMGFLGERIGRRRTMVLLALLSAAGGFGLASAPSFALTMSVAFAGMVNGMGSDRSAVFALEQAIIPGLVDDHSRTWALSWYNVLLDAGGALGALGGGIPLFLQTHAQMDLTAAYRFVFCAYAALQLMTA